MQYGNQKYSQQALQEKNGLNRTMQYGNPLFLLSFPAKTDMFKSYYVVWKPSYFSASISFHRLFKSYYVVWKLLSEVKTACDELV